MDKQTQDIINNAIERLTVTVEALRQLIPESPDNEKQARLMCSVADLNLSVRARKCMIRLGISTIGELIRHTGDDLLECKNFGVTTLSEIREKLAVYNLKLRGDRA